jgi:CBS domain-containing protein
MVSKHVRHLPVVANNKLVGIVSIRDLLRLHLETVSAEAEAMRGYIQDH